MPTVATEDYLKAILLAEEEEPGAAASTGWLAESLGLAPGTVTAMLKSLSSGGLVRYEPYYGARLTARGRRIALSVLRRHRLVELFLVEVMGLDWSEVHDEAELLEHHVSERLLARMDDMLGHPRVDPHGDPIPDAAGAMKRGPLSSLAELPAGARVRIERVADQDAAFLVRLGEAGVRPGVEVEVEVRDDVGEVLRVRAADEPEALTLALHAAGKILVAPAGEAGGPR